VEKTLNQGDRDMLSRSGEIINPIVKFPGEGIIVWGQKTAQRLPSALDRINVRRLMIVVRRMILGSTRSLVFEPNDPLTWKRVEDSLNSSLSDIKRRRGIVEFQVTCDDTTNTAARVNRNELWCKVIVKPTKTAEVLVFEVNLTNQSTDFASA
jgi:hypothetical protein